MEREKGTYSTKCLIAKKNVKKYHQDNYLTSERHEASSPRTQFAVAIRYGWGVGVSYSGSTRFLTRVSLNPGFCSVRNWEYNAT